MPQTKWSTEMQSPGRRSSLRIAICWEATVAGRWDSLRQVMANLQEAQKGWEHELVEECCGCNMGGRPERDVEKRPWHQEKPACANFQWAKRSSF